MQHPRAISCYFGISCDFLFSLTLSLVRLQWHIKACFMMQGLIFSPKYYQAVHGSGFHQSLVPGQQRPFGTRTGCPVLSTDIFTSALSGSPQRWAL